MARRASFARILLLALGVAVFAAGTQTTGALEQAPSPDDIYLNELKGDWDMSGTLLGKPVRYQARGERVLQGAFLRLHMADAVGAPPYEADVFIGFDAHAGVYVAHWLDKFGGAGARVVATGVREGPRLVIYFPYAEGTFRDTFVRQADADRWTLLLESQSKEGTWSTFANYTLTRAKKAN
jgi:hypothetical protein